MGRALSFQIEQTAMVKRAAGASRLRGSKVDVGAPRHSHRFGAQQFHCHTESNKGRHVNFARQNGGRDLLQIEGYHLSRSRVDYGNQIANKKKKMLWAGGEVGDFDAARFWDTRNSFLDLIGFVQNDVQWYINRGSSEEIVG